MSIESGSEIFSTSRASIALPSAIARVTKGNRIKFEDEYSDDFSFCDGDGVRVEERLQLGHLEELMYWFQTHKPPIIQTPSTVLGLPSIEKIKGRQAGLLTPEEFKDVITKVLGTHDFDDQLDNLFVKLDTTCDGYVDWNEFCTYMLLQFRENDYLKAKKILPFQAEPKIRHIVHNRQETTSKIVAVENPLKYVTISKDGNISVFDHYLHFEKHYTMTEGEDTGTSSQRRKIKYWVTDALYLPNCHKIVIASTGRDIRFFDVTSSFFYEEFHLYSMPDVPTCFDYYYNEKHLGDESMLIYGDDNGSINMLHFTKPMSQLFETPFQKKEGVQKIYFPDLAAHSSYVKYSQVTDIQPEAIRRIMYQKENDCIISSSANPRTSLVIIDIERKKKTYVWKLMKGIECFDYKKTLNILVTGTSDHLVRLWNPYVTSKPIAILDGHAMGIIDVKLHEGFNQVFSLSRDASLKVWDIKDQTCLQTIGIKFPTSLLGRMPEYGTYAMHLQLTPGNCLLVGSNDYIAQLKLGTTGPAKPSVPTTHLTQLCSAIYNPLFKTVITGADDSSVAVWDFETGSKSMLFTNTHDQEEITCMAFDNTWRRLYTGARNGSVKVWNIQNGHNLHEYEAIDETEVTGILPLSDKKMTITVGWSRTITQYDDSIPDAHHVKAITTWKAGIVHEEDILSIAHMPPYLMATASFDGEINIWNLDTESVYLRLRKGHSVDKSSNMYSIILGQFLRPLTAQSRPVSNTRFNHFNNLQPSNLSSRASTTKGSRPNSRHRKSHRPPVGQTPPVDKLLYLSGRTRKHKRTEAAILVSSEAGTLRFWSIYHSKHEQGYFYVPDAADECVLGLATSADNKYLVTGDTSGKICVWDISKYCVKPSEQTCTDKPDLVFSWQAHDNAIVSVDLVTHNHGQFVVTASTDFTAKLFSIQGFCVGTFGQKIQWNLKKPATWTEPPPDFVEIDVELEERSDSPTLFEDVAENGFESKPVRESTRISIPVMEKGDTLVIDEPGEALTDDDNDESMLPTISKVQKAVTAGPRVTPLNNDTDIKMATRSQTFHLGSRKTKPYKSLLGSTVDEHWSRVTRDRQARRENLERGFSSKPTNRMGKICCPYQAIAIPELKEVELPKDLPLSPRMINRGLTAENFKLEDLLASMNTTFDSDFTISQDPSGCKQGSQRAASVSSSVRLPAIKKGKIVTGPGIIGAQKSVKLSSQCSDRKLSAIPS